MNTKLKSILLLCALSVSALNVFADNKVVTSSTTESNQSYNDSDPTKGALNVIGTGVAYNGTDITLSGSNNCDYPWYNAIGTGAYINNGASLSLTDSTITTSGSGGHGISFAEFAGGGLTLNNVTIATTGNDAFGMFADYLTLPLTMNGGSITTSGNNASGAWVGSSGGSTISNVTIATTGDGSHGVEYLGSLTLIDTDIRVTGDGAYGINNISGDSTVNLDGNTLSSTGADGGSIYSQSGNVTLTGSNGSLITGDVVVTYGVTDLTLTGEGTALHGNFVKSEDGGTINFTLGTGALLHGSGELDSLTLANGALIGFTGDVLLVTDSITIGDNITIDFSSLTETGDYLVFDWSNASGGESITDTQFTLAPDTGIEGTFSVDNGQLTFNATAVPEPSTWFLIGAGLGALALIRRRSS
ncbi:MAG: PEP-CTERM sorting domain-containing protein [Verrucomicrobiales bacterium]|jgi:hypothetical protein|nr:PEP-CTERM sorting domain-containing protein [Verrucomicrobiales bacterium]